MQSHPVSIGAVCCKQPQGLKTIRPVNETYTLRPRALQKLPPYILMCCASFLIVKEQNYCHGQKTKEQNPYKPPLYEYKAVKDFLRCRLTVAATHRGGGGG